MLNLIKNSKGEGEGGKERILFFKWREGVGRKAVGRIGRSCMGV